MVLIHGVYERRNAWKGSEVEMCWKVCEKHGEVFELEHDETEQKAGDVELNREVVSAFPKNVSSRKHGSPIGTFQEACPQSDHTHFPLQGNHSDVKVVPTFRSLMSQLQRIMIYVHVVSFDQLFIGVQWRPSLLVPPNTAPAVLVLDLEHWESRQGANRNRNVHLCLRALSRPSPGTRPTRVMRRRFNQPRRMCFTLVLVER